MADSSTVIRDLQPLSTVFDLLGRVWLTEWTAELAADWQLAAPMISEMLAEPCAAVNVSDLDELGTVYCRLFIGPGDFLPLVQSVWETGQRVGAANGSMQAYFDRLACQRPIAGEPADHLGHTFWLFSRLLEGAPVSERALPVLQEYAAAHLNWARELLQRTAEVSDAAALPYSQAARVALLLLETVDECFAEDPVG